MDADAAEAMRVMLEGHAKKIGGQRRFEAACAAMQQDCQGQWNVKVSDETLAMRAKLYVRLADALLAALSARPITEGKA